VVAIEALPDLGVRAQPRNPPILRKDPGLDCPGNVAEAPQRCINPFSTRPYELADGADLEFASLEQANSEAVTRATKWFGRTEAANAE
jgi:hypothetical protein